MDLSNEDTEQDWFRAWLAIGKSMKDARGTKTSIFKIVLNSIKNYNIIQQNQKALSDGSTNNTGTGIEDIRS
jgi:hypothetical protein